MVLSARLLQPVAIWEGALTPMMRSTLDGAFWFVERADSVGVSLSNRKLQSLLYLAQAHFANANGGRRLMPAIFLAADAGPLEPTIYHIFQDGPPRIINTVPGAKVEAFLSEVWRRYAQLSDDDLAGEVAEDRHYRSAHAQGRMHEVRIAGPGRDENPKVVQAAPPGGPTPMTADGRKAAKWTPGNYAKGDQG